MITSRHNDLLKRCHALTRARTRAEQGVFLVEGPRALSAVVAAGAQVEVILRTESAPHLELPTDAPLVEVADGLLDGLTDAVTPQGWLAIVEQPDHSALRAHPPARLLVLDGVQDPGNVGTLLRTADAVGAGVLLCQGTADPLQPKVVRASAGSLVRVPWLRIPAAQAREWLADIGRAVVVLDSAGGKDLFAGGLPHPVALVAGSEAHGPGPLWAGAPRVRLPMRAGADSLNVAIATAIALYESVRQYGTGDDEAK